MSRAFTELERTTIRELLLREGRSAVAKSGFRAVTVEAIARNVGISRGAFYLFFRTKEALILEVLSRVEAEQRHELEEALSRPAKDSRELVTWFLRHVFESLQREPVLAALATPSEAAYLARSIPPGELQGRQEENDRYFEEILEGWKAEGIATDMDRKVFSAIPRAALALQMEREMIGENRYGRLLDLIIEGIAGSLISR